MRSGTVLASKFYQSMILLPYLMSWVVVSYLVYTLARSRYRPMFN